MNLRTAKRTLVALALAAGAFCWSCSSPTTEPKTVEQSPQTVDESKAPAPQPAEPAPINPAEPQPIEITEPIVAPADAPPPPPPPAPTPAPVVEEAAPSPAPEPVVEVKHEAPQQADTGTADGKRVEYAPHVTIDWSVPQVEIDARVALREGLLELLMCKTGTKEHESVLVTDADPRRIYEAMGLIGLQPGNPMMYDPQSQQYTAPAGQRLALEIRYGQGDEVKTVAAHEWMAASESLAPIDPPHWLFCGSRTEGDNYLATVDGTIACVVDFDTALIGMAERHSSNNDELWLAVAAKKIPPSVTDCKLIVRALETDPIVVVLTPESYFAIGDKVIDALQLDALIKQRIRHYPQQELKLSPAEGTPNDFARVAGRCIIGSGIAAENMTLTLHPEDNATPADSSPAAEPKEGSASPE